MIRSGLNCRAGAVLYEVDLLESHRSKPIHRGGRKDDSPNERLHPWPLNPVMACRRCERVVRRCIYPPPSRNRGIPRSLRFVLASPRRSVIASEVVRNGGVAVVVVLAIDLFVVFFFFFFLRFFFPFPVADARFTARKKKNRDIVARHRCSP